MPDFLEEIGEKLKQLLGGWTTFIALGSFLLYLLGYLSTRYYLTVLGVGTDLAVLDERYFFAGAKFMVYLVSTVPVLVLIALLPAGILASLYKVTNRVRKKKTDDTVPTLTRMKNWFCSPTVSAIVGIIISTLMIQIVMRQCFFFSNVLLAESLYKTELGLEQLLLADGEVLYFFFMALVGGTILTSSIWAYASSRTSQTAISKCANTLLLFLVIVQFLFLPINYGVYIQDRYLARVPDLGDRVPLQAGQKAWLVWEGTNTFTYLVQEGVPDAKTANAENSQSAGGQPSGAASPSPAQTQTPPSSSATSSPSATSTPAPVATESATSSPIATSSPAPSSPPPIETPGPLGRKLVSVQQKELTRTTILEYDQIIRLIFSK